METIIQAERIRTKDILKNMYVDVFDKTCILEDYLNHKKITKKRIAILFKNLKLDEISIPPLELEISELIQLEKDVNKDLEPIKGFLKENFSFKKADSVFLNVLIPSLLASLFLIYINPLIYIVCHIGIVAISLLSVRRIHNCIKKAHSLNLLSSIIKQSEVEMQKEKLKNVILNCIFFNEYLQIVDQSLKELKFWNTTEIEVKQNQFIIELIGLIRSGRVNISDKQTEVTKIIAKKFLLKNQTEINGESLYKEFNKYYKMDENEFYKHYQNLL